MMLRSIDLILFSLVSLRCSSLSGIANKPPWILGCKVFTLPDKISGNDVGELGFQAQASSSDSIPGSIISVSSSSNATSALTSIDTAIDTIANTRAKFGASENAIDHRLNYLLDAKINSTSRLSKIEDADFALETARLTKAQIMTKAASSMLAQANASGEVFLRLID